MDFCLVLEARGFSSLPQELEIWALQEKTLGQKTRLACPPAAAACPCHLLHACEGEGASRQFPPLPLTFLTNTQWRSVEKSLRVSANSLLSETLSYSTLTQSPTLGI